MTSPKPTAPKPAQTESKKDEKPAFVRKPHLTHSLRGNKQLLGLRSQLRKG